MSFTQGSNLFFLNKSLLSDSMQKMPENLISNVDLECLKSYVSESRLKSLSRVKYNNSQQVSELIDKEEKAMQAELASLTQKDSEKKCAIEKEHRLIRLLLNTAKDREAYSPANIDALYTKVGVERFFLMPFEITYLKARFDEADKDLRSGGYLSSDLIKEPVDEIFTQLSYLKVNVSEAKSSQTPFEVFDKVVDRLNALRKNMKLVSNEQKKFCDEALKAIKVQARECVKLKDTEMYRDICMGDLELANEKANQEIMRNCCLILACSFWLPVESVLCCAICPLSAVANNVSNRRVTGNNDISGLPECQVLERVPGRYSVFSPYSSCTNLVDKYDQQRGIIANNKPRIQKMTD